MSVPISKIFPDRFRMPPHQSRSTRRANSETKVSHTHLAPDSGREYAPRTEASGHAQRTAPDEGVEPVDGAPTSAVSDAPPRERAANGAAYRPGYEVVAEQILKLIAELRLR